MSAFTFCDCGHKLFHHHGTSQGDAIQQPCLMEGCDCDDFVESEGDVAPSGVGGTDE